MKYPRQASATRTLASWSRLYHSSPSPAPTSRPIKLFYLIQGMQKNENWERKLFSTSVSTKRNTGALPSLVISLTGTRFFFLTLSLFLISCIVGEESLAVWMNEVKLLMRLPQYPTSAHVAQLSTTLDFVFEKGGQASTLVEIASSISKPNRILRVCLAFQLLTRLKAAPSNKALAFDPNLLAELIPDVKSIIYLVALWNQVTVDKLKEPQWKLQR